MRIGKFDFYLLEIMMIPYVHDIARSKELRNKERSVLLTWYDKYFYP